MPRAVGYRLAESVMDPRALVKELENIRDRVARERLFSPGSGSDQDHAFAFGRAAGEIQGMQRVIEMLNDLIAVERRKEV